MNFSGVINRQGNNMFNINHIVQAPGGGQYTLPAGTSKVKVALHPDATHNYSLSSGTCKFNVFLYDDQGHYVRLTQISITANTSPIASGPIPASASDQEVNLSALAGRPLFVRYTVSSGSGATQNGNMPITIKSNTPVTAGNKIVTNDINQTGTSIASGTIMKNSKFSAGTKAEASTFNSQVLDV